MLICAFVEESRNIPKSSDDFQENCKECEAVLDYHKKIQKKWITIAKKELI
ncbi:Uncharacterized protein dnm_015310 [Desulfonema magnum]|uniref:Uncharacterized protein n=1 Tax=Desulfonema magnum TaxID=45655 RepID=A0A975BHS5_9BACT|nr:Uncharacterized protein dnm_015310 [Desulfonema magnum]